MYKYKIKVENTEYEVEFPVYKAFEELCNVRLDAEKVIDKYKRLVEISEETMKNCQYALASRIADEVKINEIEMAAAGEKLKADLAIEVRNGFLGWLMENWPKLSAAKCDCGQLVSYEKVRSTGELKCENCK